MVGGLQVSDATCTHGPLPHRIAEVENLHRMCAHFPSTVKICLEDNYRSTGAILKTSIAIISEGIYHTYLLQVSIY